MQRHYDELARYQRDGFEVIVDKTWEDLSLDQCFDTSIDPDTGRPYYDVEKMAQQIDQGDLDWFMLRVRVLLAGHELGSHYLGGCLYEDASEVLKDGTAEDCIQEALHEARREVLTLRERLNAIAVE
jgi:hypothetical protein